MYKLSMSQFTTIHYNFEEDIKLYSRMGFDGVEIFEGKLKKEKQGFEAQMELLRTSGLTISAVQPEIRTILPSKTQPVPKELLSRQLRLQESITKLSPWCQGVPFIINTGIAIGGNIKASTKAIIEFINNMLPVVKKEQVTLSLEPLNPISMNHESFIWTIDQALHIIKEINDSSLGLCLDLWNIWQNQDIVKAISRAIPYTNVLQISDWHTPRAEMDRLIPGEGEIPLKKLLTLIKSKGYHGFCTVEIFSETLNHKPVETVERSYDFLREYWL